MRSEAVIVGAAALAVSRLGYGATPPTFSAGTRTVRVPVSVLDDRGEPVLGLESGDFRVLENGRRRPVTLFSGQRRPIRIALALDVSRSMAGSMYELERALGHFVELLEPADETLVITFSEEVFVHGEFTSDRDQLERVFERLKPAPGTSLYDAALEAIGRVASAPAESKAVVLLSDGEDNASDARFSHVRELARSQEVPIFAIGMGGGGGALKDLADESGGRAILLKSAKRTPGEPDHLKAAAAAIAMTLRHRYLVGYDEPEAGKRGWRKIEVEVARPPGARVLARQGYYGT